jgi:stringent starvation protein B
MDSVLAKREFALALLQESSVFIHLDPRRDGVKVPGWLKRQPQLVLQVGLNMAVRIPDLDIGEQAISCTLSFNRSPFFCWVPWAAIFGLVGEDGRGRIWPEDVPFEIAAQMQQQASKEAAKETAKAQRQQARARLQAIPSPEVAAAKAESSADALKEVDVVSVSGTAKQSDISSVPEASGGQKPDVDPIAEKSVRPSTPAGSNRKRELPAYLRVVK